MPQGLTQATGSFEASTPRMRLTLRLRLGVLMVALYTIIIGAMLAVFTLYERAAITDQVHDELAKWASDIAIEISDKLPNVSGEDVHDARSARLDMFPFHILSIEIFHESGNRIAGTETDPIRWSELGLSTVPFSSTPLILTLPRDTLEVHASETVSTKAGVVGLASKAGERFAVVVLTGDAPLQRRFTLLSQVALATGVMSILAAVGTAWFISGVAVAPFERLRDLAKHLEPGSTSPSHQPKTVALEIANLTEELDRAKKRINDRFAAQERFLSNVSHELKTPIATMLLDAQTLNMAGAPPEIRQFVASSRDELTRLGRLVESFLTLSRILDGKGLPRRMINAANDVVMDCVQNCSKMAEQYRVVLVPKLLADEADVDASVSGDPDLLRTMLDNLIRNAIRFSPENGRVLVAISCDADAIVITTTDQGPGIPTDKLDAIFDRFAQVHRGNRYQRGHGLGLSIAQGVAELHGGSISAKNCVDHGCEFAITLPRLSSSEIERLTRRSPADVPSITASTTAAETSH